MELKIRFQRTPPFAGSTENQIYEDHIVGKASYIWFSVDPAKGGVRWNRIFSSIK